MTARTVQITVDCADPEALSRFWVEVLGYVVPPPPGREVAAGDDVFEAWHAFLDEVGVPEDRWNSSSAAQDPDGVGPRMFFQQVPEGKQVKNRLHLDVRAAPGLEGEERMAALESECERLVELGATRVERFEADPPMGSGHIVMLDPGGNEFCLD